MNIVLSSSSPARKQLMRRIRLAFTCFAPNIDESLHNNEPVHKAVERLAIAKANAAKSQHPESLIIGCDQLITVNDTILGKPTTHANAVKQLQMSSEQVLHSYTGLCLLNTTTNSSQSTVINYQVKFKQLTQSMIEQYLAIDTPYHCAGSIKAECFGFSLFTWMRGEDPTALTGLPLIALNEMLLKQKINVLKLAAHSAPTQD